MRIYVATILLVLAGWAVCGAEDTGYRVKVMVASGVDKRVEGKFVAMPEDLRIVCQGDPKGISVGDYVKVEVKDHKVVIGKMECTEMHWVR